jgi:two-component system cell cycle sensor histidine kinase PleC
LLAARERAQAADRAKSAFLATMSHELRTPLNAINGYAEIMAAAMFGPLGNARYRDYAADILASGRYLLDLVDGVLNLSSIEAGQTELETEPVDLAAVADDVVRMLDGKMHTDGLHLELDPLDGIVVQADPRALKQVLINLLDNAVKYGRPGDTVRLTAAGDHGNAVIAVCDDGPGIDADDLDRIEQPFVRGGRGAAWEAGEKPGVGLGLALVKRLVEAMHGTLQIDSDVGCGTRVEVRLPAVHRRQIMMPIGAANA